jgi:hypothetical protein
MADFDPNNLAQRLLQSNADQIQQRNAQYSTKTPYATALSPDNELLFQNWVKTTGAPYDPGSKSDYDMRGYWNALTSMDPRASTAINPNDGQMHFPDTWKTPYHQSFSNESQYATPNAPQWLNGSQLGFPNGQLMFDEKQGR